MDQVTQQNAAMVEEATAASHALTSEADTLARLISRFELGDKAQAPAQAQPRRPSTARSPQLRTTVARGGAAPAHAAQEDAGTSSRDRPDVGVTRQASVLCRGASDAADGSRRGAYFPRR